MGNQLYEENKRLTREVESLRESLRAKVDGERLPNMLEGVAFAFFQGLARISLTSRLGGGTDIRFLVDPPSAPARQPSDAS